MHSPNLANIKHKKLLLIVGLILGLLVGYFAYKYIYIYTERRKYNRATVAIQKVAADLRAQGIETEFSRGCGKNQDVYGFGALSCNVSIVYSGDENIRKVAEVSNNFVTLSEKHNFNYDKTYNYSFSINPPSGSSVYRLNDSNLQCQITFTNNWSEDTTYTTKLHCNDNAKFKLF